MRAHRWAVWTQPFSEPLHRNDKTKEADGRWEEKRDSNLRKGSLKEISAGY